MFNVGDTVFVDGTTYSGEYTGEGVIDRILGTDVRIEAQRKWFWFSLNELKRLVPTGWVKRVTYRGEPYMRVGHTLSEWTLLEDAAGLQSWVKTRDVTEKIHNPRITGDDIVKLGESILNIHKNEQDPVNPNHYKRSKEVLGVEVVDILQFFFPNDPLLWNAGKYLLRAGHKDDLVQDLRKLVWYVEKRITDGEG